MCDEWEREGEKEKKKKEREAEKTEGRKGKTASKNTVISSMTPQKSSHETRNYFAIMKQEFSGYLLPRPPSDGAKIHLNIISTYYQVLGILLRTLCRFSHMIFSTGL